MNNLVIAIPGDRPPMLVPAPCDFRGAEWGYLDATPANAREALAIHDRKFPDWGKDEDLLALAQQ